MGERLAYNKLDFIASIFEASAELQIEVIWKIMGGAQLFKNLLISTVQITTFFKLTTPNSYIIFCQVWVANIFEEQKGTKSVEMTSRYLLSISCTFLPLERPCLWAFFMESWILWNIKSLHRMNGYMIFLNFWGQNLLISTIQMTTFLLCSGAVNNWPL